MSVAWRWTGRIQHSSGRSRSNGEQVGEGQGVETGEVVRAFIFLVWEMLECDVG